MIAPRRLSGRYELGEILGLGGMSEVHLARDLRLHRDVAVKLLRLDLAEDPSVNLRFQREAQNAASLNHPAIAAVYDTGEVQTPSGTLSYIVMEFVDGVTLRDYVRTHGAMRQRQAIEVIADACQALNFSHQRGIIHRDVKPANIMIGTAGSVKVVDFGIAKAIADSDVGVTQTGAVIGTAQYLSPEQARGVRVDARADVYSLGCVLYEIATGEPPFVGDSPVAVAYQHVQVEPVKPSVLNSEITPDLDAVVLKAMAKNPDNRYQTAAEMRTDLVRVHRGQTPYAAMAGIGADGDSALAGPDINPPTAQLATQPSGDGRRHAGRSTRRWLTAVAVLAVLAIGGGIGINLLASDSRDVAVPDVHGRTSADAVAVLQNDGFKTRILQSADATVPPGLVINTDPDADTAVAAGEEITLNVSTGPVPDVSTGAAQVTVPEVRSLTYADAVRELTDAGFGRFQQASLPSQPEMKDLVVGTNPPANRIAATTTEITIVLGSGPLTPDP
ncbi:Stk1 family PASTA domain-containing Ser/Thr kinase [Mycobacterium manitobense]|uniref:Serine/threonine-protein kinase PknB n=1 Tax=[Mycobacterium] manitobense TaxID=190147 RepID=A0A9X3BSX5_9MYCO|nr:Stk1 family PASTA domain-containing Ser/Thr kinase [[Mycobacterium] manitobense]